MIYPPSSYGRDPELEALAETLATRDSFMISRTCGTRPTGSSNRSTAISNSVGAAAVTHTSHT